MASPARTYASRPLKLVLGLQGATYLAVSLWPLVHFSSFESVIGPRSDLYQFFVTDLLVLVIGAALVTAALPLTKRGRPPLSVYILATGTPTAFIVLETWYRRSLSTAYRADLVVQAVFLGLLLWFGLIRRQPRDPRSTPGAPG